MLKSIVDCHTHSYFSADSQMAVRDGVQSAIKNGLGGLIFTDHMDLDYPDPAMDLSFDFEQRIRVLNQAQHDFAGKIKILKGLELGFQPHVALKSAEIVNTYNFDFVICSVHSVDRKSLGSDGGFYDNKTKNQAYTRYLEEIYESVCAMGNDFDVVGHIGYACRYSPYTDPALKYEDQKNLLDMIFKKIIENGKGIEINTAGLARKLGFTHPEYGVIKRYKELGGQIITIGSDAHSSSSIGSNFEVVIKQLAEIGFKYVTYFENRQPVFVKI
ncbi:MAG: histidinol-phosphatase HisJ family protein [bacterium]